MGPLQDDTLVPEVFSFLLFIKLEPQSGVNESQSDGVLGRELFKGRQSMVDEILNLVALHIISVLMPTVSSCIRTWMLTLINRHHVFWLSTTNLLHSRNQAGYVFTAQVCEEFKAIARQLYDKPNSIEELAEQREYMKQIPEQLKKNQELIDKAMVDYELIEEFNYNISAEDFNAK